MGEKDSHKKIEREGRIKYKSVTVLRDQAYVARTNNNKYEVCLVDYNDFNPDPIQETFNSEIFFIQADRLNCIIAYSEEKVALI